MRTAWVASTGGHEVGIASIGGFFHNRPLHEQEQMIPPELHAQETRSFPFPSAVRVGVVGLGGFSSEAECTLPELDNPQQLLAVLMRRVPWLEGPEEAGLTER